MARCFPEAATESIKQRLGVPTQQVYPDLKSYRFDIPLSPNLLRVSGIKAKIERSGDPRGLWADRLSASMRGELRKGWLVGAMEYAVRYGNPTSEISAKAIEGLKKYDQLHYNQVIMDLVEIIDDHKECGNYDAVAFGRQWVKTRDLLPIPMRWFSRSQLAIEATSLDDTFQRLKKFGNDAYPMLRSLVNRWVEQKRGFNDGPSERVVILLLEHMDHPESDKLANCVRIKGEWGLKQRG